MVWKRVIAVFLSGLLVTAVTAIPAHASDESEIRERLNEARVTLAELRADPASVAAAREIGYAEIDADEIADRLTNHMDEAAEVAVIRLENRIKVIEGLIAQTTADELAEERETATIEMTRAADQAQVAYESTEARRAALREQVGHILNQLEIDDD